MKQADPRSVLERDRAEAERFADRAGGDRIRTLLGRAAADLSRRLTQAEALGGEGADSFTAAQLRSTLEQVRHALRPLQAGIASEVRSSAKGAAALAAEGTVRYLRTAERHFRGVVRPLPLREADMLEAATQGADASVLRRLSSDEAHPARSGILARYGTATLGDFEEILQRRFVARAPWDEVKAELVERSPFLQGKPAFWAERIARTETMGAHGRAALASMKAANDELEDLVKVLSCVVDARTGADSIAVHGEIRRLAEAFESWNGSFQAPPDRPNDRAVVVSHRLSWGPVPDYLAPRSDGEVAARWALEGRKGGPPARPRMSTVPAELFVAGKLSGEAQPAPEPPPPPPPPPSPEPIPRQRFVEGPSLGWPAPTELKRPPAKFIGTDDEGRPLFDVERTEGTGKNQTTRTVRLIPGYTDTSPENAESWTWRQETAFGRWQAAPLVDGRFESTSMLPELAEHEPIPGDYEKALDEAKRVLGSELGKKRGSASLSALAKERGEIATFDGALLKQVIPPKTLDPIHVAERMALPPKFYADAGDDALPIVVKKGGKFFLHEGAEVLAATPPAGYGRMRVIDLDKLGELGKPLDRAEWAKRSKSSFLRVLQQSPDDAATVRRSLRGVLASSGIASRDDRRTNGGMSFKASLKANPAAERLKPLDHIPKALGTHSWDGEIEVRKSEMVSASFLIDRIAKGESFATADPKTTFAQAQGLATLLHEELHGASSALGSAYTGAGVGIEEAATEILARKLTRELLGIKLDELNASTVAFGLPKVHPGFPSLAEHPRFGGAYSAPIADLFAVTADAVGADGIHAKVEAALIETRKWKPAQVWSSGQQQIDAYVDALGIKDNDKASELRRKLRSQMVI